MSVTGVVLDLLVPPLCPGCGGTLALRRPPLGLCRGCRGKLKPAPATGVCPGCGARLDARPLPEGFRCAPCRSRPPAFERLLVGWSYESPLDRALRGLKFGRLEYLGARLAEELAARHGRAIAGCHAVVPVPLHWRRRMGRGYNQAAAIARPLARLLGLPCLDALYRRRATPPQTSLDREARLRGPSAAFAPRRARRVAGRRVLLVDDVVTTGATLQAAALALSRGGATAVVALAAARTPDV